MDIIVYFVMIVYGWIIGLALFVGFRRLHNGCHVDGFITMRKEFKKVYKPKPISIVPIESDK